MERGVAEGLLVGVILFRNWNGFGTRLALHRAEINLGFVGSVAVPLPLPDGITILDTGAVTIGRSIGQRAAWSGNGVGSAEGVVEEVGTVDSTEVALGFGRGGDEQSGDDEECWMDHP